MFGRNWRRRLALLGTACLLVGVTLVAAQTIAGQISGTVVDSSKGRLPGVTVAVINEGTQATRTVVTDAQGGWVSATG
jgi:carboxypeptidase family protein